MGLRPESINNGYEKWAEGVSKLTMVMRSHETSTQPTVSLKWGIELAESRIKQWLPEYCGPVTAVVLIPLEWDNEWA